MHWNPISFGICFGFGFGQLDPQPCSFTYYSSLYVHSTAAGHVGLEGLPSLLGLLGKGYKDTRRFTRIQGKPCASIMSVTQHWESSGKCVSFFSH